MRKVTFAVLALLSVFLALPVIAQNAPLPTQTWTVVFAPMSVPGFGQTFTGTVAETGISVTPNFTAALETIQAPSSPNFAGFYGGAARYQLNFLSKKLNDLSPALSGFRFQPSVLASAGEVRVADKNHLGATAGIRVDYSLDSGAHYSPGVEFRLGRLPDVVAGWKPAVSLGFKFGW